jgi:hypothetical protein
MVDEKHDGKEIGEQQELERLLSKLQPASSRIDRDRFLFLAGRASAETVRPGATFRRWVWPGATLLSSTAVVVLSVLLVSRPQPEGFRGDAKSADIGQPNPSRGIDVPSVTKHQGIRQPSSEHVSATSNIDAGSRFAAVDSNAAPTADETARALAGDSNYPRLRSFVLAYGINALPEPAPIPQSASDSPVNNEPRTQREMLRQLLNDRAASRTDSAG